MASSKLLESSGEGEVRGLESGPTRFPMKKLTKNMITK